MPIITDCDPFGQPVPRVDRPRAPRFSQGNPTPRPTYDPIETAVRNLPPGNYVNGVYVPPPGPRDLPARPAASASAAEPKPDRNKLLVEALRAAMQFAEAHHSSCTLDPKRCAICAAVDAAADHAFQAIKAKHYHSGTQFR